MYINSSLALPSSKLPLVYRNPLTALVTTLPYIDEELDPIQKRKVNALITSELAKMDKFDYLSDLPMPQCPTTDLLRSEMDRIRKGEAMAKIDFNPKQTQFEDIQSAINNTNLQNSYAQVNLLNQELLNKYGKESWANLIKNQENEKDRLKKEVEKSTQELNHVNAQRKYEQNEVKYKLDAFKQKIAEITENNKVLEVECHNMGNEINDRLIKKLKLA